MEWNLLNNILNTSNRILLSTHVNPDGDGLGSEIAFYYYMQFLNKDCRIINSSITPKHLKFIDPENVIEVYDVKKHNDWLKEVDVSIAFDIGDCKRLNELYNQIKYNDIFSICIDHHPSHSNFFDQQHIDINMPATGFMVTPWVSGSGDGGGGGASTIGM